MKKSELKEIIKTAFTAEAKKDKVVDPYMAEGDDINLTQYPDQEGEHGNVAGKNVDEVKGEENEDVNKVKTIQQLADKLGMSVEDLEAKIESFKKSDTANIEANAKASMAEAEEIDVEDTEDIETIDVVDDEEVKSPNDSIVIDKKIVSLSSLPSSTRKILDSLETLRAQAEEFGDQKFMTQVGNTITFFTRDFVVAGDAPNPAGIEEGDESANLEREAELELESLNEVTRMKQLAGIIK